MIKNLMLWIQSHNIKNIIHGKMLIKNVQLINNHKFIKIIKKNLLKTIIKIRKNQLSILTNIMLKIIKVKLLKIINIVRNVEFIIIIIIMIRIKVLVIINKHQ